MVSLNKLTIIKNPEKQFHEEWTKKRTKLNFPHPFRSIISGPPNSGKTNIVKNIVLHQGMDGTNGIFDKILLVHCNGDSTIEYTDCVDEILPEIPPVEYWADKDINQKVLFIIEDISFKLLSKQEKENLKRLYGNVSTHKGVSTIITCQSLYDIDDPLIRRCTNLFILFPCNDNTYNKITSRKIGLPPDDLERLFRDHCKSTHDSIWIDNTGNNTSPYPIRLNGFDIIK